ncbi:MAG: Holliday junction branch migration protein RuvA [Candidatus Cloacimonetes bacterium]|nr:Holliday junction branch migration protein RuvA [Candidatus Cloacimonadota bacterium]
MFAYLKGILAEKKPVSVVIDCHGTGYELSIPLSTFERLPEPGGELKLLVHYQFSESDGPKLFGFFSAEERSLFRLLLGVSKIGPRTAIAVLSSLSVGDFSRAVMENNTGLISTVPGLGKKSAERLVLELKDKIAGISPVIITAPSASNTMAQDAESAMLTLGYSPLLIRNTLAELMKSTEFTSAEQMIKDTIKEMHKKRNK